MPSYPSSDLTPLTRRINVSALTQICVPGLGRCWKERRHILGRATPCFCPSLDSVGTQQRKTAGFSAVAYRFHNVCPRKSAPVRCPQPYLSKPVMHFKNKGVHGYKINNMQIMLLWGPCVLSHTEPGE